MKFLQTSGYTAVISLVRIAANFVAGKILAVITGPSGIALYGQFYNFVTALTPLSTGAINNGVIKYTAESMGDEEQQKSIISTSVKMAIATSVLLALTLLLAANPISRWLFDNHDYSDVIRIFGVTIIFYSLNSLFISILNGRQEIKKFTLVNLATSITSLLLTLFLVYTYHLKGAFYALVISQSIVFFITLFFITKATWFSWGYFKKKIDYALVNKLLRFSLMAIVSALCMPVAQIIIRNLVIANIGINEAGYWQGLMRISDGYLYVVTMSISTYFLPKLSSLKTKQEIKREILQGYKLLLPFVIFSTSIIFLIRVPLIKALYSTSFMPMEELFAPQFLGDLFKISSWILSYLMIAKAMTKIFLITEICFAALYIGASALSIQMLGLKGVPIAFAVTYFIYLILMIFIFKNRVFK